MNNKEDFFKNYRGRYSSYWIERWGLIPELPTSFDNANSIYELVSWLQRAFKNLLEDFQQLEAESEDFKNALIDLLEYLIPELIRRYHDAVEFRALFIILLEDILSGEERNWLKDLLKELLEVDMREWIEAYLKELYDIELKNFFLELTKARGEYANLSDRLDNTDNHYTEAISKTNALSSQVVNIVANAGNGTIPTEVIDGRTAFDGRVFSTIGEAIRTQFEGVAFSKTKSNILNIAEAVVGQYIDGLTGLKDDNVPLYQYNKIAVHPTQTYYFKFADNVHVAFFDSSNSYIVGQTNPTSLQAPPNATYMYVSYQTAQKDSFMVSMEPIIKYEPFEKGVVASEVLMNGTVDENKLSIDLQKKIANAIQIESSNILDLSQAVVGQYIDGLTGLKDNVPLYQYNKIAVYPNQTYYFKFADNVHVAFFDSSNRYIVGQTNPTSLQAPVNATYMYVSYQTAQKDGFMVSMEPITKYEPFGNRITGTLMADGAVGLSQLSEEVKKSIGATKKIILVGSGQEYTSLLKAIIDNEATVNEYRLAGYNSNIADEYMEHFGNDYFNNYVGYGAGSTNVQDRGLFLKKGDCIVGDAKSKIRFSYNGSNPIVNEFFSSLNLSVDNTVDNVSFEIGDKICRYIIHDDFAMGENGTNIIQNCHFKGNSFLSTAIGGGMSTSSTYIVDGCIFENVGFIAVTYHNSAENNALNKYIVKNCYCYDGSVIRGTWYGPSTDISRMIINGCTADRIICEAAGDIVNMSLLAFNNTIRL